MLFTILGAIIGGFGASFLLKILGVSFRRSTYFPSLFPSPGEIGILLSILVCAGIGFGYGSGQLLNGTHLFNKLF
jgi:hypothetical protein